MVFESFTFTHCLRFQSVRKTCWKLISGLFKKNIEVLKSTWYMKLQLSQQSFYIPRLGTVTFLGQLEMAEQTAHDDLSCGDPHVVNIVKL